MWPQKQAEHRKYRKPEVTTQATMQAAINCNKSRSSGMGEEAGHSEGATAVPTISMSPTATPQFTESCR